MIRPAVILYALLLMRCGSPDAYERVELTCADSLQIPSDTATPQRSIIIESDISMRHYFEAMDSICASVDSVYNVSINEYELVHANPWIIDTIMAQDYYIAKSRGVIIDNQKEQVALHAGAALRIPTQAASDSIRQMLRTITIDVNIPEYTLRVVAPDTVLHECPVRVGKNERKYLALAHHEVNLRTPIGEGTIIRIERNPLYINPVDGKRYKRTRRDDGRYTQLPRIPFLEPEINRIRSGALIHPTTNLSTLGKAVSNGCVGLSEADAWFVYYYAPLGTAVRFRYDLEVPDKAGKTILLRDIYDQKGSENQTSNDHPTD
jgi:lipoprotein-anchoring transpeptidase ErfK/SrfK